MHANCVGEGGGAEEGRCVVWVYFHDVHFEIMCPNRRMQLLCMEDTSGHFVVLPHGERVNTFIELVTMPVEVHG